MLTTENNKTKKGEKFGFLTGVLYLAPNKVAGAGNVCPHASKGCTESCLNTAGRGIYKNIQEARIRKTKEFFANPVKFLGEVNKKINLLKNRARNKGLELSVRLNGTSDIAWENLVVNGKNIFQLHPDIQFYDYTKNFNRMKRFLCGLLPSNYHLTFSRSEENRVECEKVLRLGGSVAYVFSRSRNEALPVKYRSYPVSDGDKHDLRFLQKRGIVGLRAKGKAKQDNSGFVIKV